MLGTDRKKLRYAVAAILMCTTGVLFLQPGVRGADAAALTPCTVPETVPDVAHASCSAFIDSGEHEGAVLATLHFFRGVAHYRQKGWSEALAEFERTVALAPEDFRGWQWTAYALNKLGDDTASLKALQVAYDLNPYNIAIIKSMFWRLKAHVSMDAADAFYSEVFSAHPDAIWIARELGDLRMEQEQFERAAKAYAVALRLDPRDKETPTDFFVACRMAPDQCPPLFPETRGTRPPLSCEGALGQVVERVRRYKDRILERGGFSTFEEIVADEIAFSVFALPIFLGDVLELELTPTREIASRSIALIKFVDCYDPQVKAARFAGGEVLKEFEGVYGRKVRENLLDYAYWILLEPELDVGDTGL